MPKYLFKNSFGKIVEVKPEALSRTIKGVVHCTGPNGEFWSIPQELIEVKYSPEEIEAHRKLVEQNRLTPKL